MKRIKIVPVSIYRDTDLYSQCAKKSIQIKAIGGCLGCISRRRTCQATKGVGELSRSCDPAMSEWGNPVLSNQDGAIYCGGTRGTEISKYPEEKKSNEILLVATSENGIAQTIHLCMGL